MVLPHCGGRESTLWLLERFGVDPAGVMKLGRAGFGGGSSISDPLDPAKKKSQLIFNSKNI